MKKIYKIIIFLVLIILTTFLNNFNISKANTYNQKILNVDSSNNNGIDLFPESYKNELKKLVDETGHYNWNFKPFYTDIDWNELVSTSNENKCLKNTIHKNRPDTWKCKCNREGDKNYYCASKNIVNYYLDPRNFLTEKTIFQFLDLSNTSKVSEKQIDEAIAGTYLDGSVNGESYAKIICEAANISGEGAFSIVTRIFQELGSGKELPYMISGKDPDYPGVYNFFNYGATDGEKNIKKGLEYAKNAGWTNPKKALIEGAKLVSGTYMKVGQINKYLYKFDVVGSSYKDLYNHQYMTNIEDPNSQAYNLHKTYNNSGLIDKDLTFVIPIYKNMPAFNKKPHNENINDNIYYVSSNYDSVNWREQPNGNIIGSLGKDTVVTMIQPNIDKSNGIIWGKIKKDNIIGYMSMDYLTPVNKKIDSNEPIKKEEKYLGKNKNKNPNSMVTYKGQIENIGWTNWAENGETLGIINSNERLETIKISLANPLKSEKLQYRVHVQDEGWMKWVNDGEEAGTVGQSKRIEAIQIKLRELPNYNIYYRVCIEGKKWTNWISNGEIAGTTGQSKRITAIEIKIEEAKPIDNRGKQYKGEKDIDNKSLINYNVYLKDIGWTGWRTNGQYAGSEGQRRKIEAVKIKLSNKIKDEKLQYRIHMQDVGWTEWKNEGEEIGIPDGNKRIEAIQIKLKNGDKYKLKYRTHVQDIGWMDWVENNQISGTTEKCKRIEAIQISLEEKKEEKYDIVYNTHVQDIGWMESVKNGKIAGTEGQSKRVEALKINVIDSKGKTIKDAITYQVHVQDIGWMNPVENGKIAGTVGQSKRVEAVKIKLNNNTSNKVKYRVHVQDIGWMDWVENGKTAGTVGQSKRIEAIQIVIE